MVSPARDTGYDVAVSELGDVVRAIRVRKGVSQRSLARRAGTTQAAISRIESGRESPSWERFETLLLVLGERPVLDSRPLAHDVDPGELAYGRRLTHEQRLAESASWNLVATRLEIAGARPPRAIVVTPDGAPTAPFDLSAMLATLHRHGVDYTVIGGVAVQVHGHRRTTKDLDVIASPDRQNLARLAAGLAALHARPRDVPGGAPTADHLAAAPVVSPLTTDHGELHILRDVPGAPAYADLRARALVIELDGIAVPCAGLDDLVAMKRASGRPADVRDIAALLADDDA